MAVEGEATPAFECKINGKFIERRGMACQESQCKKHPDALRMILNDEKVIVKAYGITDFVNLVEGVIAQIADAEAYALANGITRGVRPENETI